VQQGETVADIHQQQVLDNLARFIVDPYAVPSFAHATAGTSDVTDIGNTGLALSWVASGFNMLGLDFGATRQKNSNWTLTPVTDPRKLELMRCAFQRATSPCTGSGESTCCPNCQERFNEFYTGRSEGAAAAVADADTLPLPDETEEHCSAQALTGKASVNSECLQSGCWLNWGCEKCVPDCCSHVGHYCGIYVWVSPGPGRDELAKLTLAILDYAIHDDAALPTKDVVAYITADGSYTTADKANFVISATIDSDEEAASVVRAELLQDAERRAAIHQQQQNAQSYADLSPAERSTPEGRRLLQAAEDDRRQLGRTLPPLRARQRRTPQPTNLLFLEQQLDTVR
jgi:hypothetical protein